MFSCSHPRGNQGRRLDDTFVNKSTAVISSSVAHRGLVFSCVFLLTRLRPRTDLTMHENYPYFMFPLLLELSGIHTFIQEAYQQSSDKRDVGFGAPITFGVVAGVARRAGTLGGRD